jgi:hypothetical protein
MQNVAKKRKKKNYLMNAEAANTFSLMNVTCHKAEMKVSNA